MKAIFESDPIFQVLRQLYLHGANREKNEPGSYERLRSEPDDEMLADVLFACKELLPLTPDISAKKEET